MQARMSGKELLEACAAAEREMAVVPWEAPICEWEVGRVEVPLDSPPIVELGTPRGELHRSVSALDTSPRRLVLSQVADWCFCCHEFCKILLVTDTISLILAIITFLGCVQSICLFFRVKDLCLVSPSGSTTGEICKHL